VGPERSERERERASDAGGQLGHVRCGPARERSSGPKRAGRAVQSRACRRDRPAGGGGGKGPG